jgi:hypothetical protein
VTISRGQSTQVDRRNLPLRVGIRADTRVDSIGGSLNPRWCMQYPRCHTAVLLVSRTGPVVTTDAQVTLQGS